MSLWRTTPNIEQLNAIQKNTIGEVLIYEAMGLAPKGEGHRALDDGIVRAGGRLPVNKVILAKPVRTAQQDGETRPELAPQASLPDVAAGAITAGAARVVVPEHGP